MQEEQSSQCQPSVTDRSSPQRLLLHCAIQRFLGVSHSKSSPKLSILDAARGCLGSSSTGAHLLQSPGMQSRYPQRLLPPARDE